MKSYSTSDTDEKTERQNSTQIVGNKHPKDDAQIIEELKVLSGQLRDSVQCLLLQLDDRNKEIEKLKATIQVLEHEKQKGINPWYFSKHLFINTFSIVSFNLISLKGVNLILNTLKFILTAFLLQSC